MTKDELLALLNEYPGATELRLVRGGHQGDGLYATNSRSEYVNLWPVDLS